MITITISKTLAVLFGVALSVWVLADITFLLLDYLTRRRTEKLRNLTFLRVKGTPEEWEKKDEARD